MSKPRIRKKKSGRKRPTPKSSHAVQQAAASRTAVAATVAWMLALMSTLAAETIGLLCRWYTVLIAPLELLTVMSSVMLFVALISGVVTLAMVPVVLRVSETPPPSVVVRVALVAGSLPIIVLGMQFLVDR